MFVTTPRKATADSKSLRVRQIRKLRSRSTSRTTSILSEFFEVHYNIVITDCGTGIMHSAMYGILDEADALVVVSPTAQDGARSAAATLSWLTKHGYADLVSRSVVAINSTRPGSSSLDLDQLEDVFAQRGVRAVKTLPYDDHLGEGGPIDLKLLNKRTARAYLELVAAIADGFPDSVGKHASR